MKKRIEKIFSKIEKKPEIVLIRNSTDPFIDKNFYYYTGLVNGLFEDAVAILYPNGKIDLIISKLEEEIASKSDANLKIYKKQSEFYDILNVTIGSNNSIGLNFAGITHKDYCKFKNMFPKIDFFDISKPMFQVRSIKDNNEVKTIRRACEIADKVMIKVPEILHEDMFEYELAAEIDYLMQKNGAGKSAFETISSFGKNTAEPHYSHGVTKLKKDDFVLCDFGACFRKYNSDITRTFVFGKSNEKQKAMYNTVLEAQKIGLAKIKPGVKSSDVHDAVNKFIDNSKFKGCFIHSTGHSLGLAVHDGGVGFSPDNEFLLEENMVLTVEPGIYIPGFGGVRIEDDILIKKDDVELLTQSSKELIEI